jgi:uncharacterized protein (TIGR03083 family)
VSAATGSASAPIAKFEVVRAVRDERRSTLGLLQTLDPARFDTPTALPGWRVREVVAHLITTDRAAVTGGILPQVLGSMDRLEAWNDRQVRRWSERPVPDLLVALDRWGRRFARFAQALPPPVYRLRLPSMLGRGPGGLLVWVRAYDEWVHRQDIRRALGQPDQEVDVASIAAFLLRAIEVNTLPLLKGAAGTVEVAFAETPVDPWRYDLGTGRGWAAQATEPAPDASIEAPAAPFVMAAADRDRFEDLETAGHLRIEGDATLARRFLGAIRIV